MRSMRTLGSTRSPPQPPNSQKWPDVLTCCRIFYTKPLPMDRLRILSLIAALVTVTAALYQLQFQLDFNDAVGPTHGIENDTISMVPDHDSSGTQDDYPADTVQLGGPNSNPMTNNPFGQKGNDGDKGPKSGSGPGSGSSGGPGNPSKPSDTVDSSSTTWQPADAQFVNMTKDSFEHWLASYIAAQPMPTPETVLVAQPAMSGSATAVLQDYADSSNHLSISMVIKGIVSFVLLLAALYVVLSKKYDEDTRKWAFSILSMVAGFWIGAGA